MPEAVYNFAEIAKALKGDNWWKPKPVEVPLVADPLDEVLPQTQSGGLRVRTLLPFGLGYVEIPDVSNNRP